MSCCWGSRSSSRASFEKNVEIIGEKVKVVVSEPTSDTGSLVIHDEEAMEAYMDQLSKLIEKFEKVASRLEACGAAKPTLPPKPATLSFEKGSPNVVVTFFFTAA
ncbi:unnamed protein product, partial [Mesorhabditis belari]|uniref:Uncharacterized protein n=1 Tax=Mesorhabditis belari TaxID=2138241 RepID=A0AAF3FKU6_9BILA